MGRPLPPIQSPLKAWPLVEELFIKASLIKYGNQLFTLYLKSCRYEGAGYGEGRASKAKRAFLKTKQNYGGEP